MGARLESGVTFFAEVKVKVDALLAKNREVTLLAELKGFNGLARKRRKREELSGHQR